MVSADVAYVAYTLDGAEPATRPVVFAFNGGPGSASTWLHLGALGPWRVPLTIETMTAASPPALLANAETWLDFADLVFIDPPGTGYSRIWPSQPVTAPVAVPPVDGNAARRRGRVGIASTIGTERFWSVSGDIAVFVRVIDSWLTRHERRTSPVVLVGESYGGFRAPLIAEELANAHSIAVRAMVLVSPVLDFDGRRGSWRLPQSHVALLPSMAATRLERTGTVPSRAALADVEAYARSDYLVDLLRGPRDVPAVLRMAERVAALSGIPIESVTGQAARFTIGTFLALSPDLKDTGASIYDAGMAGFAPARGERRGGFADPFTAGLDPPLTSAMETLYQQLNWRPGRPYAMLANEINRRWIWPNSPHPPQALSALLGLHRKDVRLATLVTHGLTDLVTPYLASAIQLDQVPVHATNRISLEVYPGGHMFYSRDASRARFRDDARRIIDDAIGPGTKKEAGDRRETP